MGPAALRPCARDGNAADVVDPDAQAGDPLETQPDADRTHPGRVVSESAHRPVPEARQASDLDSRAPREEGELRRSAGDQLRACSGMQPRIINLLPQQIFDLAAQLDISTAGRCGCDFAVVP